MEACEGGSTVYRVTVMTPESAGVVFWRVKRFEASTERNEDTLAGDSVSVYVHAVSS